MADLLPPPAKTGRLESNLRRVIDGILWVLRTGAPGRSLSEHEFGPWETVYGWFRKWTPSGLWDQILRCLQAAAVEAEEIDEELWCADGTVVRAHQFAAGGRGGIMGAFPAGGDHGVHLS